MLQKSLQPFLYEAFTKETREQMCNSFSSAMRELFETCDTNFTEGVSVEMTDTGVVNINIPVTCVEFAEAVENKPIEQQIIEAEVAGEHQHANFLRALSRVDMRYDARRDHVSFKLLPA